MEGESAADLDPLKLYEKEGAGVKVVMHGQDGQALLQRGDILMTLAADGHSDKLGGVAYSKYALWLLPNRTMEVMPKVIELIKTGDTGEPLCRLMKETLFDLDVYLRTECPYTKVRSWAPPSPAALVPHPLTAGYDHAE